MIITIDGPAGAGKSTVARRLADILGFELLDTGAMYRAVTYLAREENVSASDDAALRALLGRTSLDLRPGEVLADGRDISHAIRTPEVTAAIQGFADSRIVRQFVTERTRQWARGRNVVTEGRDQGSEVFPDADAKFFVTANDDVRATRRHAELLAKGHRITLAEVLASQKRRDQQDEARPVGRLLCPKDAFVIDASRLTEEEVLSAILARLPRGLQPIDSRDQVQTLARDFIAQGDPLGWFDALYASAHRDTSKIPWADRRPNEHLMGWLDRERVVGDGQKALVVGCGLGDDAHRLAGVGFQVTAFDLSPTAIDWARERFGNDNPRFQVANLFSPPPDYRHAFDFVFEAYTWQALPPETRASAIAQVANLVAPGGRLLVVSRARDEQALPSGPPWPLALSEFAPLEEAGLVRESLEDFIDGESIRRFRLVMQAPRNAHPEKNSPG
jgi:cytidylate kinase